MSAQIACSPKYPIDRWALRVQDALMVSAFGIWSVVLGLSPILIFHAVAS